MLPKEFKPWTVGEFVTFADFWSIYLIFIFWDIISQKLLVGYHIYERERILLDIAKFLRKNALANLFLKIFS